MAGKLVLFPEYPPTEDKIYECLTDTSDNDDNVETILGVLLPAMAKLVAKEFKDFLPGGKYADQRATPKTDSVEKHNVFPERMFGFLDHILKYKPNISTLAAEAYVMFVTNKTSQWLEDKDKQTTEDLVRTARCSGLLLRKKFQERSEAIRAERKRKQEEEMRLHQEKRNRKVRRLEKITEEITKYGLWKNSPEIENGLRKLKTTKDKRDALCAQLRFRKQVLGQSVTNMNLFNMTYVLAGRRKPLTVCQLKSNLKQLVNQTNHQAPEQ